MTPLYQSLDRTLARLGQTPLFSTKVCLYICALNGALGGLFFLFGLVAAHNVGPMKPWWSAEKTAKFWQDHLAGAQTGAALLMLSGMFYLPFSSAVWWQMRRIPRLHPIVPAIQLSSGAAGVWTLSGPGVILAAIVFRPYRNPEITRMFTEFFWITTFAPWATFMTQSWSWAYAIISDPRPNPPIPRGIALINFMAPICYSPAIAMHVTERGPVAWNGALSFWVPGAAFVILMISDAIFLCRAVSIELAEGRVFQDVYAEPLLDDIYARSAESKVATETRNGVVDA